MEMESNETGNSSMQEYPRFLAQSYLMYKICKQNIYLIPHKQYIRAQWSFS